MRFFFPSIAKTLSFLSRTALLTSGWSFRATLRYAALISAFEAERGTPRTTWAGRGEEDEDDDAAATIIATAEFFVAVLGPLLAALLLFLCSWTDDEAEAAAVGEAAMLCLRGEGTAAATRGRTQRIVTQA